MPPEDVPAGFPESQCRGRPGMRVVAVSLPRLQRECCALPARGGPMSSLLGGRAAAPPAPLRYHFRNLCSINQQCTQLPTPNRARCPGRFGKCVADKGSSRRQKARGALSGRRLLGRKIGPPMSLAQGGDGSVYEPQQTAAASNEMKQPEQHAADPPPDLAARAPTTTGL
ncbi:hypothetical protein HPB50_024213 [Hyalomma asiaticum]|uniref:Uncharacterized protein n=1 Tax=Hyalomma asiaticum TaxID=266040 RepID=A0ACB7SP16_HYAAI|nr:hypothetical protein HPB50_024213 [Hyalomma asiaticum]